jgi:FkbM family methyltransferase
MKAIHAVVFSLCLTSVVQFFFIMRWQAYVPAKVDTATPIFQPQPEKPVAVEPQLIVRESPKTESQPLKANYLLSWKAINKNTLGCADFGKLYPLIASLYDSEKAPPLIDIGANLGAISSEWLNTLTQIDEKRWQKETKEFIRGCGLPRKNPKILAVEGLPKTYELLMRRATAGNWTQYGWEALNVIIADKSGERVLFQTHGQQLGLSSIYKAKEGEGVPAITVDEIVATKLPNEKEIFILKIDIEGFDPAAIVGAHDTLSKQLPRFIMFEYHHLWKNYDNGSWSLKRMQQHLLGYGYNCYFISPDNLYPISGEFWDDAYEIKNWSNVIAVRNSDPDFVKIMNFYNSIV